MESIRQQKFASVIQKDITEILQEVLRNNAKKNLILTVTKVNVTSDLLNAKIYLSVFPSEKAKDILIELYKIKSHIKHQLATRTKNQLRRIPELDFFIDDSLDYIDKIDNELKHKENPIKNPSSLDKRKHT